MNAATQPAAKRDSQLERALAWAALEALPEGLILVENDRVLLANPAGARLLGYEDPDLVVGQPVKRFFSHGEFCRDVLRGPSPSQCEHPSCEWTIRRPDQEEVRVAVRCTRFLHANRALVLAAFHEARQAEIGRMVWDGESRFRTIFEGAAIGMSGWDA